MNWRETRRFDHVTGGQTCSGLKHCMPLRRYFLSLIHPRRLAMAANTRGTDPHLWSKIAVGGIQVELFNKPLQKSANDDRDYRLIRLPNSLEAILIHDPTADKAAASMDVAVGSLSDPVSSTILDKQSLSYCGRRTTCQAWLIFASTFYSWFVRSSS